ncbi:MAG: nuclear transport factor 2 family protein [Usitatibacter sp.]
MDPPNLKRPKSRGTAEEAVLEAIRSGYRDRDVAKVMSAYAEDVESTIVNRNNPPSRPLILSGRAALRRMVEDICSREMTHAITGTTAGDGAVSYRVECRYPDGCNVVGLYMATVKGGLIVKEFSIDCWDE